MQVGGLLAVGVALDEEVEGAGLVGAGDWCVGPQDGEDAAFGEGDC